MHFDNVRDSNVSQFYIRAIVTYVCLNLYARMRRIRGCALMLSRRHVLHLNELPYVKFDKHLDTNSS